MSTKLREKSWGKLSVRLFCEKLWEKLSVSSPLLTLWEIYGRCCGDVVGAVEVVGDIADVVAGVPDTAVVFDMPTQAFQLSIPSAQSVVIDAPAISTTVVFWPLIMSQIVTVT